MDTNIVKDLVDFFGNQEKTASSLGVTQSAVSQWSNGHAKISVIVAIRAERATEGKFKASDLCPDLRQPATVKAS